MENLLCGRLKNNFSDEKISSLVFGIQIKPVKPKTLSDYTKVLDNHVSDAWIGVGNISFNTDLSDAKMRLIAQKLAKALDSNSVNEIKNIKCEYGHEKEFLKAKKFLDEKCKEVWNVYENPINIPFEAMKALGITNQPSLNFLLKNTVKHFEKDGGNTTSKTISNIINNKYMDYKIEDIHKYLSDMHIKENCEYNSNTIRYLILNHDYDEKKLKELGVKKDSIIEVLKTFTLKQKAKYLAKGLSLCFN